MNRDFHNEFAAATSLAPAARTASANGTGIDLAGYRTCAFVWNVGAITDGTHTPKIQDSDDNSSFSDVSASFQSGTLAALTANTNQECSYIGTKRYVRAVTTITGSPSTGGVYAALAVRGAPVTGPA